MEPQGRVKKLVDAMQAAAPDKLWFPADVRKAMDIPAESSIAAFSTCDAIALLPGWQLSRGARLEFDIAVALSMPVHFLGAA